MAGSFRAAAEKLDVNVSVIARQIKLLEDEMSVVLFERRGRGVIPTESAELLLEYYRGCLAQEERLVGQLQELRGLGRGSVSVIVSEGFAEALLNDVVNEFCHQYPKLDVTVNIGSINEVVNKVLEDVIHIGIVFNPPPHAEIRIHARAAQPVRLMVSSRHPLAKLGLSKITLAQASEYSIGLMGEAFGLRQVVKLAEFSERIKLTPALTTNSVAILKQFVLGGHGATFMSDFPLLREISEGKVVAIKIDNELFESTEGQIIVRRARPVSMAVAELLKQITTKLSVFRNQN